MYIYKMNFDMSHGISIAVKLNDMEEDKKAHNVARSKMLHALGDMIKELLTPQVTSVGTLEISNVLNIPPDERKVLLLPKKDAYIFIKAIMEGSADQKQFQLDYNQINDREWKSDLQAAEIIIAEHYSALKEKAMNEKGGGGYKKRRKLKRRSSKKRKSIRKKTNRKKTTKKKTRRRRR
jgi:hypothetical protein